MPRCADDPDGMAAAGPPDGRVPGEYDDPDSPLKRDQRFNPLISPVFPVRYCDSGLLQVRQAARVERFSCARTMRSIIFSDLSPSVSAVSTHTSVIPISSS